MALYNNCISLTIPVYGKREVAYSISILFCKTWRWYSKVFIESDLVTAADMSAILLSAEGAANKLGFCSVVMSMSMGSLEVVVVSMAMLASLGNKMVLVDILVAEVVLVIWVLVGGNAGDVREIVVRQGNPRMGIAFQKLLLSK